MSLRILGKQINISNTFRTRIDGRVGNSIDKYFDRGFSEHVILVRFGSRYAADCMMRLCSGRSLQATGEAQEQTIAFDAVVDKLETRLRRYKRRLRSHASVADDGDITDVAYSIVVALDDEDEEIPENCAPVIVAESTVVLKTMSVASAVIELDTKDTTVKDTPMVVCCNASSEQINIVCRQPDGNIG